MFRLARAFLTLALILVAGGPAFASGEMLFEANEGQADPEVQFLARTQSYTLLLKRSNAVLLLKGNAAGALTMRFAGSNQKAAISGLAASTAKIHYFSGSESAAGGAAGGPRRRPCFSDADGRALMPARN